jgi:hypothetical protein
VPPRADVVKRHNINLWKRDVSLCDTPSMEMSEW